MHQTFVAGDYLACRWVYHWRRKVCIVDAFSVCRWYEFSWRESSWDGTRASCNVIAVSALWLINRALARVPPPSILYGGMIITGDVLSLTLLDWRVLLVLGAPAVSMLVQFLLFLGGLPVYYFGFVDGVCAPLWSSCTSPLGPAFGSPGHPRFAVLSRCVWGSL